MVSGGEHKTKKVLLRNDRVHPSITRAVDIIKKDWEQLCLRDQDILGNAKQWSKVLALIGDDDLRGDLEGKMEKEKDGVARWNMMRQRILDYVNSRNWKERKTSSNVLSEIMLQFAYPRFFLKTTQQKISNVHHFDRKYQARHCCVEGDEPFIEGPVCHPPQNWQGVCSIQGR